MRTRRINIFETNSSTQHSLTFAFGAEKQDLKSIIGSDIIRFGVRTEEEIDKKAKKKKNWAVEVDNTLSWQDRADILWYKLLGSSTYKALDFVIAQERIKKLFEERGIKTEFIVNEEYLVSNIYSEVDDVDSVLLDWRDNDFELHVINFIFSPYILEYSYEDDLVSWNEIEKIEKDFAEVTNGFPKDAVGFSESCRE